MRLKTRIKLALIHRADQGKQNLMILMTGAGTFLIGFLLMNFAEYFLLSSVTQELIALLGLILAIVGVIIAAFGYICLSFLRIFRVINTDTAHSSKKKKS